MEQQHTELTWAALAAAVARWLREELPRAAMLSAVAFAISYVVNLTVMALPYGGFDVPSGSRELVTGRGTMISGAIFWAALSSLVTATWTYGRRAGWERLRQEVLSFPQHVRDALGGENRTRALATLTWAATASLVLSVFIGPASAGVGAAFVVVFASTPLAQLIGGVVRRLWMSLLVRLLPDAGPATGGFAGAVAAAAGTAGGMGAAFVVESDLLVVLLALVTGGLTWRYARMDGPPATPALGLLLLAVAVLVVREIGHAGQALADDGGWSEYCFGQPDCTPWGYLTSQGAVQLVVRSGVAGIAAAIGAPFGAALGDVLGSMPASTPPAPGAPTGPTGPSSTPPPTTTRTVTLTGQAAEDALAAGVGAEIAIPGDERWDTVIGTEGTGDPAHREGYIGERGRISDVGAVVRGEDGSIVIAVEVEVAADPGPPPADANAPLGPEPSLRPDPDATGPSDPAAPPDPAAEPDPAAQPDPAAAAPADPAPIPPAQSDTTAPPAPTPPDVTTPTTPPDMTPPTAPPDVTTPTDSGPPPPEVEPPPVTQPRQPEGDDHWHRDRDGDGVPDHLQPEAGASPVEGRIDAFTPAELDEVADRLEGRLARDGLFTGEERRAIGDFVRGEHDEMRLPPAAGSSMDIPPGKVWGVNFTVEGYEPAPGGGVRITLSTRVGAEVHVDVRADGHGGVDVLLDEDIRNIPVLGGWAQEQLGGLGDAIDRAGRSIQSVQLDEDGAIVIRTADG